MTRRKILVQARGAAIDLPARDALSARQGSTMTIWSLQRLSDMLRLAAKYAVEVDRADVAGEYRWALAATQLLIEAEEVAHAKKEVADVPSSALLVDTTEAAHRLGISRSKLYKLLVDGRLQSVHIGKRRLVPVAALNDYIDRLAKGEDRAGTRAGGDHGVCADPLDTGPPTSCPE